MQPMSSLEMKPIHPVCCPHIPRSQTRGKVHYLPDCCLRQFQFVHSSDAADGSVASSDCDAVNVVNAFEKGRQNGRRLRHVAWLTEQREVGMGICIWVPTRAGMGRRDVIGFFSGHYMCRQFNIQQFHVLPTHCIYVFCVDLRTNSHYFPIQH